MVTDTQQQTRGGGRVLVCDNCGGSGVVDGKRCEQCQGVGQGLWIDGWWVYWGKEYSSGLLAQEQLERAMRWLLDVVFFVCGLAGLGWLSLTIVTAHLQGIAVFDIDFYFSPNLRWFWWLVLTDMYVVYRLVEESEIRQRVVRQKPATLPDMTSIDWQHVHSLHRRAWVDMSKALSWRAHRVVNRAWTAARVLKQETVQPVHILLAMIAVGGADMIFARLAVNTYTFVAQIKRSLTKGVVRSEPQLDPASVRVLLNAYLEAYRERHAMVAPVDILVALASESGVTMEILRDHAVDQTKVRHVAEWLDFHQTYVSRARAYRRLSSLRPKGEMNRSYTAVVTPFLDHFSHDLTMYARAGAFAPLVNRRNEIEEVFQLFVSGHRGVVIVGDLGTGRTALIEGIAQQMIAEDVPKLLRDQRLVSISVGALVAGASGLGSAEQRLLGVLGEAQRSGNIVLCFDNIQELVGVGSERGSTLDLAQVLTDAMERSGLLMLATVTPADYTQYIEKTDLTRSFEVVHLDELDFETTIRVLESHAPQVESHSQALLSYPALSELVHLSDRYMHDRRLPEKAISLMEEVAHRASSVRGRWTVVTPEDVQQLVSEKTSIPLTAVTGDESQKLLHLEDLMHRRVVDQTEAVTAVATALRRARTELREEKHPIVNLLFLGPTGVGKTEVARTLASVYFGSEDAMLRFDMSEYQYAGSVERLLGVPGGPAGLLTEAVRKKPFALVLLDEFEKAHTNILNLFLQVMDDGRLTDASGVTVDFTNTIIIATSNAGAFYIQDALKRGESVDSIRSALLERELRENFRPELLNRFDNIVVFKPLGMGEVQQITKMMLDRMVANLAKREIGFSYDEAVVAKLSELGFSPEYGARPLRRAIQEHVQDTMAKIMLENKIGRRDVIHLGPNFEWNVEKAKAL